MAIEQKVPVKLSSDNWGQDVGLVDQCTQHQVVER